MIFTVVQTSWRRLRNSPSELILTFIVPIIFFSIFALIFGSKNSASTTPKIRVVISVPNALLAADANSRPLMRPVHSYSQFIEDVVRLLQDQQSLRFVQESNQDGSLVHVSRSEAESLVRRGMVSAAIVFETQSHSLVADRTDVERVAGSTIDILTDSYDQVASQVLTSIVQRSVFLARGGSGAVPVGGLDEAMVQRHFAIDNSRVSAATALLPGDGGAAQRAYASSQAGFEMPLVQPAIRTLDLIGAGKTNPAITMYAAGIAVMFLLFSATTASGSLLEERENSTLDRLLCSQLTMDQLLLGKWAYLSLIGCGQMLCMFLWGAVVFGIELQRHWDGFIAMTLVTAGAAASFALMLATLCKTRTQLGWVSTIVILSMSALGGSMVPRYLMSETMQQVGLVTFNAWALEGFNKVFWRELPLEQLGLELSVLAMSAAIFIVLARLFAVRWERS